MPFAQADGARIFWRCDGRDDRPALLLANSIGCDHAFGDPVVPALARRFRVIRYDMRGHGASDAPARTDWARLLKRVFDLDLEHCSRCGGDLRIIAATEQPALMAKILTHPGLPARAPPRAPARPLALLQAAPDPPKARTALQPGRASRTAWAPVAGEAACLEGRQLGVASRGESSSRAGSLRQTAPDHPRSTSSRGGSTVVRQGKGGLKILYARYDLDGGLGRTVEWWRHREQERSSEPSASRKSLSTLTGNPWCAKTGVSQGRATFIRTRRSRSFQITG